MNQNCIAAYTLRFTYGLALFSKFRSTATSLAMPVRNAGSTSGAKNGEGLDGSDIPADVLGAIQQIASDKG